MLKILSLGAGVQSSTLALLAERGKIEKPDYAIFANTGWEPNHCYKWLDWLETQLSYPILRVENGNIKDDLIENINNNKRFASIPFFTSSGGLIRRQCTAEYKIKPIQKKIKELLGYKKGQRIPKDSVKMLIGISRDEIQRMKPSRVGWITHQWPLIDLSMTRNDCLAWMKKNNYPEPPKSSCIGCPYHSNGHWRHMKINNPNEWLEACLIDDMLRINKTRKNMYYQEYMHSSRIPLKNAPLGDEWTVDMFHNECEGMCGV